MKSRERKPSEVKERTYVKEARNGLMQQGLAANSFEKRQTTERWNLARTTVERSRAGKGIDGSAWSPERTPKPKTKTFLPPVKLNPSGAGKKSPSPHPDALRRFERDSSEGLEEMELMFKHVDDHLRIRDDHAVLALLLGYQGRLAAAQVLAALAETGERGEGSPVEAEVGKVAADQAGEDGKDGLADTESRDPGERGKDHPVEPAAKKQGSRRSSLAINLVDFGAGQGSNSVLPAAATLQACQLGAAKSQGDFSKVTVVHVDLPASKGWKALLSVLQKASIYNTPREAVYATTIRRSFYLQCVEAKTLLGGWCLDSLHCLSAVPLGMEDSLIANMTSDFEKKRQFAAVAMQDWNAFLEARAAELVSGGFVLVEMPCSAPGCRTDVACVPATYRHQESFPEDAQMYAEARQAERHTETRASASSTVGPLRVSCSADTCFGDIPWEGGNQHWAAINAACKHMQSIGMLKPELVESLCFPFYYRSPETLLEAVRCSKARLKVAWSRLRLVPDDWAWPTLKAEEAATLKRDTLAATLSNEGMQGNTASSDSLQKRVAKARAAWVKGWTHGTLSENLDEVRCSIFYERVEKELLKLPFQRWLFARMYIILVKT
ncbi:hypothetical protein CYMTET_25855 [Cymbomonas tetramitiformis]|uniref:Uncharacterized protein n=1 Tax=Cymbomonas tetramitiformis TaxID=36881 RepID=A0AAE0FSW8_9CHLO|nr:hypothetical protein CYMTET_25855 [Cymbomonas tetramitiformis]